MHNNKYNENSCKPSWFLHLQHLNDPKKLQLHRMSAINFSGEFCSNGFSCSKMQFSKPSASWPQIKNTIPNLWSWIPGFENPRNAQYAMLFVPKYEKCLCAIRHVCRVVNHAGKENYCLISLVINFLQTSNIQSSSSFSIILDVPLKTFAFSKWFSNIGLRFLHKSITSKKKKHIYLPSQVFCHVREEADSSTT